MGYILGKTVYLIKSTKTIEQAVQAVINSTKTIEQEIINSTKTIEQEIPKNNKTKKQMRSTAFTALTQKKIGT